MEMSASLHSGYICFRNDNGDASQLDIPSLITRTTNDVVQMQMLIAMGLQIMIKAPITAIGAYLMNEAAVTERASIIGNMTAFTQYVLQVVMASGESLISTS